MSQRSLTAISMGIWLGALSGLATAFADFGAHWLFMESGHDRLTLFVRLLATQVPGAALLGATAGLVFGAAALAISRLRLDLRAEQRVRSAAFAAALAPLSWLVAKLLFSGGSMSRLSLRPVLVPITFAVLLAGTFFGVDVAQRVFAFGCKASRRSVRAVLAVLIAGAFCIGKLNQLVLPNLYDYLHAVLGALSLGLYALAFAIVITRAVAANLLPARSSTAALGLALVLGWAFFANVTALDGNQNVRVALLSANMPYSRSLMLGIGPLLPRTDQKTADAARKRAELARKQRARSSEDSGLPTLDGAHVLLITVDALRPDHLGAYGYGRPISPELDALASRGVVFERAYTQAPHSSYSLCSIMTSEYLHETLELGHSAPTDTLPRTLGAAGYHTAGFYTQGIFHTAGEKLALYENDAFGFALHEHQDRPADDMTNRVLTEIDRTLARGEPSSLFWVHYFDVHEPYEATTLGTSDVDRYDGEILAADKGIGRLVREAEHRLKKPLVVIITSDHGEEFHEHGGVYHGSSLYDEQVRVPLIVYTSALAPRRVSAPVESVDIAPTVLGLLGLDVPESMRGADLRSLAVGKTTDRGPVFSAVIHKKMVVSWPYKLVADLRFSLFELYDLVRDPRERDNLADRDPQRVQALRGEVYAWLDSLTPESAAAKSPHRLALEWGRLGDRRAVEPLSRLVVDEAADATARSEGARLLGKLADPLSADPLLRATRSRDGWVAAESAIALGRMFDPRAAPLLRRLVHAEDPEIRSRAAVSLGRLRDVAAVPALIEAMSFSPSTYEREEAVRWLGRLGDARALDPLINLLPEAHTRHLAVLALGEIGDPRAFEALSQVLDYERNTNVRDGVVRGLGVLGDQRALPLLMSLFVEDASLRNAAESLVRLGALEQGLLGGADVDRRFANQSGFGDCYTGPMRHDWDYQHRTYCTTRAPLVSLPLELPARIADAPHGGFAVLGVKRVDSVAATELTITVAGRALETVRVDGEWTELRWPLDADLLRRDGLRADLQAKDPNARFEVDHLLLAPKAGAEAPLAHGG